MEMMSLVKHETLIVSLCVGLLTTFQILFHLFVSLLFNLC